MALGDERLEQERKLITEAAGKGPLASLVAFTKLSGPGWLQSAITLGGGSLASSLYLGVLLGVGSMWLQPAAMIFGVIMLSAIAYVTLSTGRRPFEAINNEISPVLGWAWLIGTMMANMVWCMPQFSLGAGALTQNLLPSKMTDVSAIVVLFVCAMSVIWSYNSGRRGVKIFEGLLKALVGVVVLSFFGVVLKMAFTGDGLPWGRIFSGFLPNSGTFGISPELETELSKTGAFAEFWRSQVKAAQFPTVISAAATAVGINMTFLLPYSLLRKKWDRDFRGLAVFDLSTGLFVPYVLATSCVVIAAAAQFHAQPEPGILSSVDANGDPIVVDANTTKGVNTLLDKRIMVGEKLSQTEFQAKYTDDQRLAAAREALPLADRAAAAILVKRDNKQLSRALNDLAGKNIGDVLFGIGVLAMAISTIIILMLINGFALCEALGHEPTSGTFRIGCLLAGISGAMGYKFLWTGDAKAWLVIPTSMFGFALLPIAYVTFFLMMNSRRLLGDDMPTGLNRLKWNALMLVSMTFAIIGAISAIYYSDPVKQAVGFGALGLLIVLSFVFRAKPKQPVQSS